MTKMTRKCGWCEAPIFTGSFCLYTDCFDKHYDQWRRLCRENNTDHYRGHVPNKREIEEKQG